MAAFLCVKLCNFGNVQHIRPTILHYRNEYKRHHLTPLKYLEYLKSNIFESMNPVILNNAAITQHSV